jgi:hypothetical protein
MAVARSITSASLAGLIQSMVSERKWSLWNRPEEEKARLGTPRQEKVEWLL